MRVKNVSLYAHEQQGGKENCTGTKYASTSGATYLIFSTEDSIRAVKKKNSVQITKDILHPEV